MSYQRRTRLLTLISLAGLLSFLFFCFGTAAAQSLIEGEPVLTITDAYWVKLRSAPTLDPSAVVSKIAGGTQVRSLRSEGDWYQVALPDGTEGWISAEFAVEDFARSHLTVTASLARVRQSDDLASALVTKAVKGLKLHILGQRGDWYNVLLPDGSQGWVRNDLVEIERVKPPSPREESRRNREVGTQLIAAGQPSTAGAVLKANPPAPTPPAASAAEVSSWLPEKPEALLVSFVVGTSMFIVLSLAGTLIVFQRNLNQIKTKLPEAISDNSDLGLDESTASEMSDLIKTTDNDLNDLDEAIEGCLQALRQPNEHQEESSENGGGDMAYLATTIHRQQQQITHYLELLSLQHKKLNAYQRENLRVRRMMTGVSVAPVQNHITFPYRPRRQSAGLSIKPA